MPLTISGGIVVVTENRAQLRCSPSHTDLCLVTGFCISSHSSAQTFTIPTSVTGASVSDTRVEVRARVHLRVAGLKGKACDDAALLLGPGRPVAVGVTGVTDELGVGAARRKLPAVSKIQDIGHSLARTCGEFIQAVTVVVSTQTTHLTLELWR